MLTSSVTASGIWGSEMSCRNCVQYLPAALTISHFPEKHFLVFFVGLFVVVVVFATEAFY